MRTTNDGSIPASYIIYKEGSTIKAVNGTTGIVDYSGTDFSKVIQCVINALTTGGKIFIKNGIYIVISTITIANNYITIQGESWKTILQLGANVNVFTINAKEGQTSSWYLIFRDFKIDGQRSSYNTGHGISGAMRRCLFERLLISNIPQDGIVYNTGTGCMVIDCIIEASGRYGIVPLGTDSYITNCVVAQSIDSGICIDAATTSVEHCHIWGCLNGIILSTQGTKTALSISDNIIEDNRQYGIKAVNYSVWDSIISNNQFFKNSQDVSNTYDDIYVELSSPYQFRNNVITGNLFYGSSRTRYAINLVDGDDECIISNNVMKTHLTASMIYTGTDHIIKNNSGYVTENKGSILTSDGSTIPHGLAKIPTSVNATPSIAGELVAVTSISSTTFTVAIKKRDGTIGTPQTIYWNAEV